MNFVTGSDEQRSLSDDLESLIELMISADEEDDHETDEGIGDEVDVKRSGLIDQVLVKCCQCASISQQNANIHFKSICRFVI